MHPAALPDDALLAQCQERRVRRGGPGGQHRNKVESGIVLLHRPTGTVAEATERRQQAENRGIALGRLRRGLALSVRHPSGPPCALWNARIHFRRLQINPEHDHFPILLADALDLLAGHDWHPPAVAALLDLSTTQLIRFLALEPRALALLNVQRAQRGASAYRP